MKRLITHPATQIGLLGIAAVLAVWALLGLVMDTIDYTAMIHP